MWVTGIWSFAGTLVAASTVLSGTTPSSVAGPGSASGAGAWQDASPHRTLFVTVEDGVKLEVLDWGGSGRPLVLLAASGWTAHVFDDLLPGCHNYYQAATLPSPKSGRAMGMVPWNGRRASFASSISKPSPGLSGNGK
jgi:hypothetical protein